jgi:hypothetical protein
MNWELLSKRLIALSAIGGTIDHHSGHRWLSFSPACGGFFDVYCESKKHNVPYPRSKRYDGIESILDDVDQFLEAIGHARLSDVYNTYNGMMKDEDDGDNPLVTLKVSP